MCGVGENIVDAALFDQFAGIHDADFVGESCDDRQVVGDPYERRARFTAKLLHFVKYLPLDGDVQRGGGFIGNDEIGLIEQGDGDGHALAHSAGELVGVGLQALVGGGDADALQRITRLGKRGLGGNISMCVDGLDHLGVHAQHRVERHHWILKDHRDAIAAQLLHGRGTEAAQVLPVQQNLPRDYLPRRINQAHEGIAGHRFSGSGFAHQPHDLAACD